MTVIYNELDPFAAEWLRNLIDAGHIAPGIVDERPIQEIEPYELTGYTQCHFFAGIGIWSKALRDAGWADDRPIWTGSCPCQPFSNAGKQKGFSDERHLWPHWFNLIKECKPSVVIGEQVASALDWLDLVQADMEASDYAFGASDLCAAGFDGAHIRQRLYFVALADDDDDDDARLQGCQQFRPAKSRYQGQSIERAGSVSGLGHSTGQRRNRVENPGRASRRNSPEINGGIIRMEYVPSNGREQRRSKSGERGSVRGCGEMRTDPPMLGRTPVDWLYCRDGKWRPVEPGTFPLAHEAPSRVGRLRAYGNALDLETATQFCETVKEICNGI